MQKQLFRQYDIRGKIGTEIAINDFYNLTHAILSFFKQSGCTAIVVGMDGRVHCPAIFQQISAACKIAGVDLYFIGVCSTPITVFAHYHLPVQASLMITASHNPADYNGLKIYYEKVAIEGEKLQQIYELFVKKVVVQGDKLGEIFDAVHVIDEYVDSLVTEFVHLKNYQAPVFIDCGNGTGGPILTRLIDKMGWKNKHLLFEKVDGTYPNHVADPTDIENVQELLAVVKNNAGSFGIGLDGDCDRVAVITRDKNLLAADQLLTLFACAMEAKIIVADIKSSSVLNYAQTHVILAKTGCANIKTVMTEHQALLGGELSGHFFFKDRHAGYDDGIYGMLRFFEILQSKNISCDDFVAQLPESFATKDIRIPCLDQKKFEIVQTIKAQLLQENKFKITMIDGVRFETVDGWGLIRPSNTQPVLSVCCEATSAEKLQNMKNLLKNLLQHHIDMQILEQYIL
ncbi:phosphomannomutase/phosphoglucomutase [Candidatus Babeliales bacterium]|nr:phosphomannomutase/phosphoglucomutase [Candidatus Babeliales bacterium]MBP9843565.1 phosphomannomutase/phosphoglucomutase [Candidatus Babeliales bacterium]